jgi:hypothetical protein
MEKGKKKKAQRRGKWLVIKKYPKWRRTYRKAYKINQSN